jgi:hypothetical protein
MHEGATSGIPKSTSLFITSDMNVEEGHIFGVRHVGGLGHVAPISVVGIFANTMQTAAGGGLHRFVLVRGRAMQRDVARYETK